MFCDSQSPTLETQLPSFGLCIAVLSKHLQPVPQLPAGPLDRGLALGWEWRCFLIHRGSFLKISVSKQKSRIIYPSLMWWIWIYIELNCLLLLLKVNPSVQIVLLLGLFAEISFHRLPFRWEGRPLCAQAPVQKASFHHAVPSPVASYSLVHVFMIFLYTCVPFIQLFTNLILNLLNDCAKNYPVLMDVMCETIYFMCSYIFSITN